MSWFLCLVENEILIVEGGETQPGSVSSISPGSNVCFLKVVTTEGAVRLVKLEDFLVHKNTLCERFKKACERESRSLFSKIFRKVYREEIEDSATDTSTGTERSSSDATSSPNSPQLKPTSGLQRQLVEEKAVGRCVAVHLDNLLAPSQEHQTRALDLKHVQELKESFSKNPEQLVVLYGSVEECYTAEQLKTSGGAKVYVIGGNHTRVALQSLTENGIWRQETIQMTVYQGLSQDEALFLGVHHNAVHNLARPMSFLEKVQLIRELGGKSKTISKKEKIDFNIRLMKVFDYETPKKARHNLKNHVALARCSSDVWALVQAVGDAWDRQAIAGQPRKKIIEQTFFKKLVSASEESILSSLRTLLNEGYKAYLKTLNNRNADESVNRDEGANERMDDEDGNSNELDSEEVKSRQELEEENRLLREEVELLRQENQALKIKVQQCSTPKSTTSVQQSSRGTKRKESDKVYEVGTIVEALWRDKNPAFTAWYPATVRSICKNDDYMVSFHDSMDDQYQLTKKQVRG